MVPIGVFVLFIIFALFSAGRLVRPLLLPVIIIMTLGYVLHLAGVFNSPADPGKSRHRSSQRTTDDQ